MEDIKKFLEEFEKDPDNKDESRPVPDYLLRASAELSIDISFLPSNDFYSLKTSCILMGIFGHLCAVKKDVPRDLFYSVGERETLQKCLGYTMLHAIQPCVDKNYRILFPGITSAEDVLSIEAQRAREAKAIDFMLLIFRNMDKIQCTGLYDMFVLLFLVVVLYGKFSKLPAFLGEPPASYDQFLRAFEEWVPLEKYFQTLLLLMGLPNPPNVPSVNAFRDWLHHKLLELISRPQGIRSLSNLMLKGDDTEAMPMWSKCEILAKLVVGVSPTKRFLTVIYPQLATMYRIAVEQKEERFIAASIACFDHLLKLELPAVGTTDFLRASVIKKGLFDAIEFTFAEKWMQLASPNDLLTGLCVLDETEIRQQIEINYIAFCGHSQMSRVPTKVIQRFVPLIFQFSTLFTGTGGEKVVVEERKHLQEIIVHALANRSPEELKEIVEKILFPNGEGNVNPKVDDFSSSKHVTLHKRIGVKYNPVTNGFSAIILSIGETAEKTSDYAMEFVNLLKGSNNNLMIFNVFMAILKLFDEIMGENEDQQKDGLERDLNAHLVTEEDAESFIGRVFMRKSVIISTLAELIAYKPFHFQFTENPKEILDFIQNLLRRKVEGERSSSDEQVLVLIFSIFREFIDGQAERYEKEVKEIQTLARNLRENCDGMKDLKLQIDFFLGEWQGNKANDGDDKELVSKYAIAKELCQNQEPYLRVYGMREMMQLIRSKDAETMANLHAILLGALVYIKDEDSYSFLTCIQLLVLLTTHLEGTVIETLVAEFQDKTMSMDYRLKIGEAIVKTVEGLGAFAVKYKEMFINCFLRGVAENEETLNEYRVSCIFNLGQICKLLTYQVRSFFNEMIKSLERILEQDEYLPARRAAALLLTDLLRGMENLVDFQDYLLPVYRLLKHICENDADEKTRVHANAGLDCLKEKIKEALNPMERLEKEIRIFGIETEKEKTVLLPK